MKPKIISTVGLDIGSYSIKCVKMAQKQDGVYLEAIWLLNLASSDPAGISKTLQAILQMMPEPPKRARISVSGPNVLIRQVKLPQMTPAELKGAIRFEAERHIPFSIDDCMLDYQKLGDSTDKKTMNILIVVARRDLINERVKVLSDLGVDPDLIDVDAFCAINAYQLLGETQEQAKSSYSILNIGHTLSSFAIIHDGLPHFVREMAYGGKAVTQALMQMKSIGEDEADIYKMEPEGKDPAELTDATRRGFESMIGELKHSIDYYENEVGEEFSTIFMSGGGAKSFGLPAVIAEEVGKEVLAWDNCKRLSQDKNLDTQFLQAHASELNVAYGLSLRGLNAGLISK